MPKSWPWEYRFWKPSPDDRIKELVKAGALFQAHYDLRGSEMTLSYIDLCAKEIDSILEQSNKCHECRGRGKVRIPYTENKKIVCENCKGTGLEQ